MTTAVVVAKKMFSVHLKGGDTLFISEEAAKAVATKSAGFVQVGDEFVNVFEILRMRPVKMTDLEQAIFSYPAETRAKVLARRSELQEKLGRDFKDPAEVHRYVELGC